MAKPRHEQPETSKSTMLILGAGGLLVLALVVWALTRTVEPASVMTPESSVADATTGAPAVGDTGFSTTASTTPTPTGTTPNVQVTPPPAPAPVPAGDRAEVRRMAVEDLRAKNDRGEVTVVDVRDAASFAQEHIPGAINIPFASIEGQADMIPKGKPIVTYCT